MWKDGLAKRTFRTLFLYPDWVIESYKIKVKTDKDSYVTDVIYWKGNDSSDHGHVWGIDKDPEEMGGRDSKD